MGPHGTEHCSPLSSILRPLITTQINELVVMTLLVTVTVEGVLHLEFAHLGARPPSLLEQIASAKKLLLRSDMSQRVRSVPRLKR
jgi:hypothetical protein